MSSFSVTSLCPLDRSQRRSSLSAGRGHSRAEQRSRVTGVSRACPPAFRRGREAVEHTPPRSAPARPWRRKGGGDAGVFVVSASAGDRGPREYPGLPHGGQGSCPRPWGLATTPLLSPAPDGEPEEFIPGAGAGGGDRADAEQTKAGGHVASGLWRSIPCALLPRPCFGDGYFESFQSKAVPLQALNKGPDLFFFWQHNPLRSHSPRHFSHVNIP